MAYFHPKFGSVFITQDVMIKLQELAGDVVSTGTSCRAEIEGTRPDWESWIVASSKRRTLFTTYLFDNVVSFNTGIPCFIGTELASLPVSASALLWKASTREAWNSEYNLHLSEWSDGELLISELWPQPKADQTRRQRRIDRWLLSVDEFGMMLFSVTLLIHGG